jgi:hypothetical protein
MTPSDLKPISREDAIVALKALQTDSDPEAEHAEADEILCRLLKTFGFDEVIEEWWKVKKWYA